MLCVRNASFLARQPGYKYYSKGISYSNRRFFRIDASLSLKEKWIERDYARLFHLTFLRFKFAQLSNEDNQ